MSLPSMKSASLASVGSAPSRLSIFHPRASVLSRRTAGRYDRSTIHATPATSDGSPELCNAGMEGAGPQSNRRRAMLFASIATTLLHQKLDIPLAVAAEADGGVALTGKALEAVDEALKESISKGKAPAVLRCVFHDAGTYDITAGDGGANASLRYETKRPENKGIKRGLNCVTEAMKRIVGTEAEGKVSYADMIALAGAYAVMVTGGPRVAIPVGRFDTEQADPEGRLPAETLTVDQLKANFASKGLSCQELVALSGSHTIGGKGFGEPLVFDNEYYKALLRKPWNDPAVEMGSMIGLQTDHVLPEDEECLRYIQMYAEDQELFFRDFSKAFLKLTVSGAKWA